MLGALAGDIIGSVYEWHNIKTTHFDFFSPNCFFTNDTVLTVAHAEGTHKSLRYHPSVLGLIEFSTPVTQTAQKRGKVKKNVPRPYHITVDELEHIVNQLKKVLEKQKRGEKK